MQYYCRREQTVSTMWETTLSLIVIKHILLHMSQMSIYMFPLHNNNNWCALSEKHTAYNEKLSEYLTYQLNDIFFMFKYMLYSFQLSLKSINSILVTLDSIIKSNINC